MDLSKYSRAQYFRPQIGAFHWALCVVWFTYPMKNRVYCVKRKGGKRSIMYDIIIRNGRVIDPQNKFDAKADVAIYNGKSSASVIIRTQKATAFLMPQGTLLPPA